jgi:hypothetical protein
MKTKFLTIIITTLLLTACKGDPKHTTERVYLRQMNVGSNMTTTTSGSFFVIFGSYDSQSKMTYKLRGLGQIGGEYRFLDLDLNKVSFKLDSTATTPYIVVQYETQKTYDLKEDFDFLFSSPLPTDCIKYIITCHPDLVPQQLSQVKI